MTREMLAFDLLIHSGPQKIKWWRNWEATFGPVRAVLTAQGPREMVLHDIALCWYVAPSLAEQWAHFNVAFFTREGSRGYYGWSFAS